MSINENEDLTQALEVLADRQPPAGPPPTAELLRRGRLGRRRRAAVMTGGVAAVAAVAMAGAFAVGIGGGSPTASGLGPAAGASGKPTSTSSPSGKPTNTSSPSTDPTSTGSPAKPADLPTAGPLKPDMLEERIPAGYHVISTWKDQHPLPGGQGQEWRVGTGHSITNGSRTGDVRIELAQVAGVPRGTTGYQPTATCGAAPDCTVTHRPDGSVLIVDLPPVVNGFEGWKATLYGTDGGMVTAASGSVTATSVFPDPRAVEDRPPVPPVLTVDQLTALALDPIWQTVLKQY
ncbi:hypothetical protein TR51_28735 [Kitasatospora griseola]|uniref:Uncharacterized protein n=1 Tax=Kitasatospora griseola TaxID=2064 RepID=A0A0D0PK20_KITGR|nr:hypothetical protein [Kitasatospora griseola]KIQ62884.1 hypothetical protein TR51_28735 [Kitasatospora griseola]